MNITSYDAKIYREADVFEKPAISNTHTHSQLFISENSGSRSRYRLTRGSWKYITVDSSNTSNEIRRTSAVSPRAKLLADFTSFYFLIPWKTHAPLALPTIPAMTWNFRTLACLQPFIFASPISIPKSNAYRCPAKLFTNRELY